MCLNLDKTLKLNQFRTVFAFLLFTFLTNFNPVFAQLVTFTGAGNFTIPLGAPAITQGIVESPCNVSGIGVIGGCVSIDNVQIDVTHSWVGDIGIFLFGPDGPNGGRVLELSTGNGGSWNDYSNTVFTDNTSLFITSGVPPFFGTYRPEGRDNDLLPPYSNVNPLGGFTFGNTFNGLNADGVWTLYINDYVADNVGEVLGWSITFNIGSPGPAANLGPDLTICQGEGIPLFANAGDTYLWSTGSTATILEVFPTTTTTYSVTVSYANCQSTSTDMIEVVVKPKPTITLSAVNTNICASGCLNLTATLTGDPPFTFAYTTTDSNGTETMFEQSFDLLTQQFQVCVPPDASVGSLVVAGTSIFDSFCVCE
jgi:subtilisin-like proprotein convertase family protein